MTLKRGPVNAFILSVIGERGRQPRGPPPHRAASYARAENGSSETHLMQCAMPPGMSAIRSGFPTGASNTPRMTSGPVRRRSDRGIERLPSARSHLQPNIIPAMHACGNCALAIAIYPGAALGLREKKTIRARASGWGGGSNARDSTSCAFVCARPTGRCFGSTGARAECQRRFHEFKDCTTKTIASGG